MSAPEIGACYDCTQVTDGRCWRHKGDVLIIPPVVQATGINYQGAARGCEYVDGEYLMPGWICCACRTYNGLQRQECKFCPHTRCST